MLSKTKGEFEDSNEQQADANYDMFDYVASSQAAMMDLSLRGRIIFIKGYILSIKGSIDRPIPERLDCIN